jgi:hypothetical protein
MPNLFQNLFRSSPKTKGSTSAKFSPSATPHASTSHTHDHSAVNLDLIASPIVESRQIGVPGDRKQRCIEWGITALELLKEIGDANGVLSPLKAVCGVTLAILNTIKVRFWLPFCYCGILIDIFRLWIIITKRGRRYWKLSINTVACLNSNSTRRIWSR